MGEGRKDKEASRRGGSPGGECRVCRFPLLVALLQLLLGVTVTAAAFLTLAISPSLLARETPHWAGIILCVVSLFGFVLYCLNRQPDETSSAQFIVKIVYFVLCVAGLVISALAVAFAGHHHAQASGFTCQQAGEEGCVCVLDPHDPLARTFTYEMVGDCEALTGSLTFYFLLQILLNLAQALVCAVGAFMLWKNCYQVFFSGLQISSTQQWQKV